MAEHRLSAAAEADIETIYLYTYQTFGARQAEVYASGLKQSLERLADLPRIGPSADDLRPGLF